MRTGTKTIIGLVAGMTVMLASCNKNNDDLNSGNNNNNQNINGSLKKLTISLRQRNDAELYRSVLHTTLYEEINVDIERVTIHYGDSLSGGGWTEIPANAGIYNLTDIGNIGVVLANDSLLLPGYISQMRLILGDSNSVMVDSVLHDLKTPSAQESGLKINLDYNLLPDYQYEIYLSVDPDKSIVQTGNGKYLLKPVIRVDTIISIPPVSFATEAASHSSRLVAPGAGAE